MLNFILYSLRWQMILHRQVGKASHKLSLWRMYWHRMTGYAVGYLTPLNQAGGEPVRVALLIADKVPSESAVASATLDIAFELCSYVVFIALGVIFALVEHQGGTGTLVTMGVGLAVAFAVLFSFFVALARGKAMARPLFHKLRLDKIIYAVEACAVNLACLLIILFANFNEASRFPRNNSLVALGVVAILLANARNENCGFLVFKSMNLQ